MSDQKISAFADGGAPASGDEFPIARSGANKKISWDEIQAALRTLPDPSGEPDGAWLKTSGGAAVWVPTPAVTESDLSLSDVTTANASTTKHGLLRKLSGSTNDILRGDGTFGDLAKASGVAAGTYGDSGHVPQVTVDAQGRVTGASNVAIAGGSQGLTILKTVTLGADAATIDTGAAAWGTGHGMLLVQLKIRSTLASTVDTLYMQFNGDTGANYSSQRMNVGGTTNTFSGTHAGSTAQAPLITCPAASDGAVAFAMFSGTIPFYDDTAFSVFQFTGHGTFVISSSNLQYDAGGVTWFPSTPAAISQITIGSINAANIQAGSKLIVYGAF